MSRELYLECYSGISGDMTVAALLDLGVEPSDLIEELKKLHLDGYEIKITETKKNQIRAMDFDVILTEEEPHHVHNHAHDHTHAHNSYREIRAFIQASDLTARVKDRILKIFHVIAEAEAAVHGTSVEEVHFHEVGAVDSIVDVAAVAICMERLGFDRILISELWEGKGTTWCQHGRIPVPAPAVLEMLANSSLRVHFTGVEGEMITPTGAGIAVALADKRALPDSFIIERIGVGAGKKEFPHANILRAMILCTEEYPAAEREQRQEEEPKTGELQNPVRVLETNVDDCSGEVLGYTMERLLEAGALDVCCMPLYMKKNRPAYLLQVLCRPEQEAVMESIIFQETTSIGLRKYTEERTVLPREMIRVKLPGGQEVRIKKCTHHGEIFYYPEYEDVRQICLDNGKAFRSVYEQAVQAAVFF